MTCCPPASSSAFPTRRSRSRRGRGHGNPSHGRRIGPRHGPMLSLSPVSRYAHASRIPGSSQAYPGLSRVKTFVTIRVPPLSPARLEADVGDVPGRGSRHPTYPGLSRVSKLLIDRTPDVSACSRRGRSPTPAGAAASPVSRCDRESRIPGSSRIIPAYPGLKL